MHTCPCVKPVGKTHSLCSHAQVLSLHIGSTFLLAEFYGTSSTAFTSTCYLLRTWVRWVWYLNTCDMLSHSNIIRELLRYRRIVDSWYTGTILPGGIPRIHPCLHVDQKAHPSRTSKPDSCSWHKDRQKKTLWTNLLSSPWSPNLMKSWFFLASEPLSHLTSRTIHGPRLLYNV